MYVLRKDKKDKKEDMVAYLQEVMFTTDNEALKEQIENVVKKNRIQIRRFIKMYGLGEEGKTEYDLMQEDLERIYFLENIIHEVQKFHASLTEGSYSDVTSGLENSSCSAPVSDNSKYYAEMEEIVKKWGESIIKSHEFTCGKDSLYWELRNFL